jgi:hypothetical protein
MDFFGDARFRCRSGTGGGSLRASRIYILCFPPSLRPLVLPAAIAKCFSTINLFLLACCSLTFSASSSHGAGARRECGCHRRRRRALHRQQERANNSGT